MTHLKSKLVFPLFFGLVFFFNLFTSALAQDVKRMTKEELINIMDDPAVSILDVRKGRDWSSSEFKIKGAQRMDIDHIVFDAKKFPRNWTLVLYCA